MKKKINIILGLALLLFVSTSCEDFLDVRPKGEKLEDDLFEKASGFEDAIYGVYGTLQSTSLYGRDLLWGINEVLAQDLRCDATSVDGLSTYDYTSNDYLRTRFSSIWTTAYQSIGYANNILQQLEKHSADEFELYNHYKGEMLGVRAMLHFDLLRMFASTNESERGIPYVTKYTFAVTPFSTVGEVYKNIIADLQQAEILLADEEGNLSYPRSNNNYYSFENYRETHFNLYAVRALLARVYWMKGDMTNAVKYAENVIGSGCFPLVDETEVQDYLAGTLSPKETIFGVYSTTYASTATSYLYNYTSFYSYYPYDDASGKTHILPYTSLYKLDVSGTAQDYRLNHFIQKTGYSQFLKLVDYYTIENNVPTSRSSLIAGVTLMHTSELYLIAAEGLLSSNYDKAVDYFNAEISSRGLTPLRDETTLTEEMIFNEYHKEMFGEGQVWFNMKRLNKDITSNAESRIIPANDDIYVIPVPEEEFEYREDN
jgi:hypothetical protein